MSNYRKIFNIARPAQLIFLVIMYSLGAGIARYLGHSINYSAFGLGLSVILMIAAAAYWLSEYFQLPSLPLAPKETREYRETFRASLFHFTIAALTVAGAILLTMIIARLISMISVIMGGFFLLFHFILYALAPKNFKEAGYREILLAISIGTLTPAFAFLLQYGQFHRLLTFVTFPLTLLAVAYLLASDFPNFANDTKFKHHSLLTRLTWQKAIPIHHFLILVAFLILAIAPLFGIPWGLVWPIFLILPFSILQIIWLQRIAGGGRTLWKFFMALASATFGLAGYMLLMAFWFR